MCGITAFFSRSKNVPTKTLENAVRSLIHRGPDNQRVWLSADRRVGLGHTRLSIIDLDTGDQPAEPFDQMLQDTLRGNTLASLPFYDQRKVVALLDDLPAMSNADRVGWDPILMSILSACVLQQRFNLDDSVSEG